MRALALGFFALLVIVVAFIVIPRIVSEVVRWRQRDD